MDSLGRMNQAMLYIEEHLTQEIDYTEVARIACCSEYHFKRMFSFLAEISLSEYIRRRRLTLAALDLRNANLRVLDVAVKYGYRSADAFARAFYAVHGVLPSEARSEDIPLKAYPKMSFQLSIRGGNEMNYRIVEKEAFQVVGVKYEVAMVNELLSPTYEEMVGAISDTQMTELAALSNYEPHGIIHVSTNYAEDKNGNASFEQYISAATTEQSKEFSTLKIPTNLWVIFEVDGDWQQIEETWQRIYTEWLPSSSYELAEGPEILASKENTSEIWISIKAK